jgi:hypothetical protein
VSFSGILTRKEGKKEYGRCETQGNDFRNGNDFQQGRKRANFPKAV